MTDDAEVYVTTDVEVISDILQAIVALPTDANRAALAQEIDGIMCVGCGKLDPSCPCSDHE